MQINTPFLALIKIYDKYLKGNPGDFAHIVSILLFEQRYM